MMIDFDEAVSMLKGSDNVLVLTHANPDGDTLGSGFALVRALRDMGKRAQLINSDPIPAKYGYLYEDIPQQSFEADFIVSTDVAEKKLLGDEVCGKYAHRVDLAIDHHSAGRPFAKKTYVDSGSASACEIVYLLIRAMGASVTKEIADCIYTGCSTDTGCFRYSNVTAQSHRIAAELIDFGADHGKINERMFETKSRGSIMLEKLCLDSLEFFFGGKAAMISVTQDMLSRCGVDKSALDAIKPITRQIEGVEIGITLKQERQGVTGVSLRTGENYDASAICGHFGGGGHKRAAGCEIKGSVEEAAEKIKAYIENEIGA